MQNSSAPSNDLTTNTPPPPPTQPAALTSFPPPAHNHIPYQQRPPYTAPRQHPSVTVQMSPRNLTIGGSVLAFLILAAILIAVFSGGSSHPTPNIYSNGTFPATFPDANTGGTQPGSTTTTDSNGNSVTMGPGAHSVQNSDGSTTTTDANGNSSTQGGGGNGSNAGFPGQQQSPFQGDSSFPQQQQQGGYPQQQGDFPQQQQGYPQQQGGYNPQQSYPR